MINQRLRHYSSKELAWRQWVTSWQTQGFDLRQGIVPGRHLLHVASDAGWEGIIDLENWFSQRVPQSAGLANASWSVEQLETLFLHCIRPIEGLPAQFDYQRLENKGRVPPSSIDSAMYACLTPYGRVWLCDFPALTQEVTQGNQLDARIIPINIQFKVGYSLISLALLKQIKQGDVLMINQQETVFAAEGSELGRFMRMEEGFMFDEKHPDNFSEDEKEETQQAEATESIAEALVSRDAVKVKLGFVLQQNTISIAELESFYRGKVLPCHSDAENNMLITANGVTIAKGELVLIEDRLGVEIKDIYQEVGDGPR